MELHEPITFEQTSFSDRTLEAEPATEVRHALASLRDRHAFFFTGAGSSVGDPTGLPSGRQLAEILAEWGRETGAAERLEALADPGDLGEVCAVLVEAFDRETVVREIRKAVDWRESKVNLCHLALALLYAEGMLQISFTANWDPKVEDALDRVVCESRPRVARDRDTMGEVGGDPCLVHLHGHYEHPASLVMTEADLARPDAIQWTNPMLKSALTQNDPIFVGFAAEPEYVIRSLSEMRAAMQRAPAGVIAIEALADFCANSAALADALRLAEDPTRYIQGNALEIMGELLRCCYRKLLSDLLSDAEARARAGEATGAVLSEAGIERVRVALFGLTLERFLGFLWGSAAKVAASGASGQATLLCLRSALAEALAVVMVLASCNAVEELAVKGSGFRLKREDGSPVDLWPALPRDHLNPTDAVKRAYRHGDRFAGPADAAVPLVVVCAGTSGALPRDGKVSLTGSAKPANLAGGMREPRSVIDLSEVDARFRDGGTADLSTGLGF
jgi:hypothetical protein